MPSEGVYLIPHYLLSSFNYHQSTISLRIPIHRLIIEKKFYRKKILIEKNFIEKKILIGLEKKNFNRKFYTTIF